MNAMVGKLSAFAGCAMGLAFAAAAPLEMPEVFRDAAKCRAAAGGMLAADGSECASSPSAAVLWYNSTP